VTTSTVSIIGPAGSNFTSATAVYVNGVRMIHVVRSDQRVEFTMQPGAPGAAVDVVLVKASGSITFPLAYTFEAVTIRTLNPNTGGVLTTTSGITISVPPQSRASQPRLASGMVITYAPAQSPANVPGDVLMRTFDLHATLGGAALVSVTQPLRMNIRVNELVMPAGQLPWLYEWTPSDQWALVPGQSYDPQTGVVTASTNRFGTYVLVTADLQRLWLPQIRLR